MVHGNLLQNLGVLQLSLKNILLVPLPDPVARFRDLLNLAQDLVVVLQNWQGLLKVSELKIHEFQCLDCLTPHPVRLIVDRVSFALRNLGSETTLAWIWKLLRCPDAHVSKVAIGKPCERSWTSNAELLGK